MPFHLLKNSQLDIGLSGASKMSAVGGKPLSQKFLETGVMCHAEIGSTAEIQVLPAVQVYRSAGYAMGFQRDAD